jgi:hypothetical protein
MQLTPQDKGGVIDALVNYWITKIAFEDAGEKIAVPECNLETCAGEALFQYLGDDRQLTASIAFELGIELAAIVARNPLDAGAEIRATVAQALSDSKSDLQDRLRLVAG